MKTTTLTRWRSQFSSGLALLAGGWLSANAGQIVHDGTVGPAGALIGPAYLIPDTAGTTRGKNLFHSFSQFDLDSGDSATFTGPPDIKNIITRVTGGSASTIDGTIDTTAMPTANFFFINPFGITFGPNAVLNVGGSVAVTTADYVKLADGGRFDARNPANDILTTAPVSAFGFLGPTAAPIQILGVTEDPDNPSIFTFLPDGKSFWAVGGDITHQGTAVAAPGGEIAYVSVASAGELAVDVDNPRFVPDTSPFSMLGTIALADFANLYLDGSSGGFVALEADRITFRNHSGISAPNDGDGLGGGIQLIARSEIDLELGNSRSVVLGLGDGGDIILTAPTITLRSYTFSTGTFGDGNSGNVIISANNVSILDGGGIGSGSFGSGAGGEIRITANHILLRGDPVNDSAPTLSSDTFNGPAGNIHLEANSIEFLAGANIRSDSVGGANVGGEIFIKAQTLTLDDQSYVRYPTLSSRSFNGGGGGGQITLDVGQLTLLNGAQITTTSENAGPAGSINIHATDVTLTGSSIASAASADGAAGSIILDVTGTLQLNESQISVIAAQAAGGDITITAGNEIQLINSSLSAQANLDGGNITLTAPNEVYLLNSQIKAESTTGNGGNITIDPTFVVLNNSSLIANAITGNGGNITIDSQYFFVSDSLIDASSQFGVQGSIFITALNFDVTGNLLTLPGNPLDAEARLRPHCAIRLPHGASSFTVTGRSQLPAEPDGLLPAFP